jgi:transaldolase
MTTNPTILLRDGVPACAPKVLGVLAAQAWALGAQELHLQAWGGSAAALYSAGLDLAAIDPRIVVKVPATAAGVEAASLLKGAGAAVTLTGLVAAHQAVSAVGVGADYAAPYLSRIPASAPGRDGRLEVGAMQAVVENLDARTRILVASVKAVEDVVVLATQGLSTFTLGPALLGELLGSEAATEAAAAEFEAAARQLGAV